MTTDKLSICRAAFESWRHQRTGKRIIPDKLWLQAVSLLDDYPISRVAKELRLNATQLRQKQLAFKPQQPLGEHIKEQVSFLELNHLLPIANNPSGLETSTLDLLIERVDGTRLTLSIPASDNNLVQTLLAASMNPRRSLKFRQSTCSITCFCFARPNLLAFKTTKCT